MPTRRPHQKTKLGCATCRKRRVKCDQNRPDCKNCVKRGVKCSFRTFDPAARPFQSREDRALSAASVSPDPATPASPSSLITLDTLAQSSLLEDIPEVIQPRFRRLLHHFATSTSATITQNKLAQEAWCGAAPQLAASHRFVRQGMYAISALHLSQCMGMEKERKHFHDIAAAQMNTGLVRYRETVENVTADNAEALFVFSITATAFILVTTVDECNDVLRSNRPGHYDLDQRRATAADLVRMVVKIMRTLRGVLVILVPCWYPIANGILAPIARRDWWPKYPVPTSPQAVEEDRKLGELEKLWVQPGRRYEYWTDTLILALKTLREQFAMVSLLTAPNEPNGNQVAGQLLDWTCVMHWPVASSPGFISLLEQRQPEAWIIIAHYAMLPARAKNVWCIADLAPILVSTAALVLGEEMWKWIEWPASVVGVDLNKFRQESSVLSQVDT